MTILGAGLSPAGAAPAGYGSPDAASPLAGDALSNANGRQLTGRYIDPKTKQYVFDANGRVIGFETVPQLVLLAMTTVKGSSAVAKLGNEFQTLTVIGDGTKAQCESVVRSALSQLIAKKLVQILSIDITRFSQSGEFIHVRWMDLTTGTEHTASV